MTPQRPQGMQTKDKDEAFLEPELRRSIIQEVPGHIADTVGGSNNGAGVSFNGETFVEPGWRRSVIQYVPGPPFVEEMTTKATNKGTTGHEVWVPGLNGGNIDAAEVSFKYIRPADQNSLEDNMDSVGNVTLAKESGEIRELEDNLCMVMDNYDFDISDDLPEIN